MPGIHYRWETMDDAARRVAEEFPIIAGARKDGRQHQTIPQRGVTYFAKRGRWERSKPWRSVGCGDPRQVR